MKTTPKKITRFKKERFFSIPALAQNITRTKSARRETRMTKSLFIP